MFGSSINGATAVLIRLSLLSSTLTKTSSVLSSPLSVASIDTSASPGKASLCTMVERTLFSCFARQEIHRRNSSKSGCPARVFRLRNFTKGRRPRFTKMIRPHISAANPMAPTPAMTPMAAEHHSVAAVFSPCTVKPWRKIMPAPRKPMPETTWAATRVGLTSCGNRAAKTTNPAAPSDTNALVLRPAMR